MVLCYNSPNRLGYVGMLFIRKSLCFNGYVLEETWKIMKHRKNVKTADIGCKKLYGTI